MAEGELLGRSCYSFSVSWKRLLGRSRRVGVVLELTLGWPWFAVPLRSR